MHSPIGPVGPVPSVPHGEETVEVPKLTNAVFRGLDLVLEHHGASTKVRSQLQQQMSGYLDASQSVQVWLKRVKSLLNYPNAKYLRNELPTAPDGGHFRPSGALRGWMKARLNAFNRKNTHLWFSWLQCKRAALPLPEHVVDKMYDGHLEKMTSPDVGDDDIIHDTFHDPRFQKVLHDVKVAFEKELSRLRARKGPLGVDSDTQGSPSLSAAFERTRGEGGAYAELASRAGVSWHPKTDLVKMVFLPRVIRRHGHDLFNVVKEVYASPFAEDWSDLKKKCRSDVAVARELGGRHLACTIQAVLEPLKARIISKGEAVPYYLAKPFQQALYSSIKHLSCFRLISRTLCPTDLMGIPDRSGRDEWFSVDYSGATDGLSWSFSGMILKYLTCDLCDEDRHLVGLVLGPHELYYPVKAPGGRREPTHRGTQVSGQLMGSPLSFPILCLANLAVYLRVTRDFHQEQGVGLRQALDSVLVNGDDMLYRAPPELWDQHVDIANGVGLEMTPGKAYHHRVYANVNSTALHCAPGQTPWQIDYLNSGLFFGQGKVLGDGDDVDAAAWRTCSSLSEERFSRLLSRAGVDPVEDARVTSVIMRLLKGCLPGHEREILSKYLSLHKEQLRSQCAAVVRDGNKHRLFTRNLFLPISRGGFGLIPPIGFKVKYSRIQKSVARSLVIAPSCATQLPVPGYVLAKWQEPHAPWEDRAFSGEVEIFSTRKTRTGGGGGKWWTDQIPWSACRAACLA